MILSTNVNTRGKYLEGIRKELISSLVYVENLEEEEAGGQKEKTFLLGGDDAEVTRQRRCLPLVEFATFSRQKWENEAESFVSSYQRKEINFTKNKEKCLIESTKNSVRCSFRLKYHQQQSLGVVLDPIEEVLCYKYMRFFTQRAQKFVILRKEPIEGYTISFLVTKKHLLDLSSVMQQEYKSSSLSPSKNSSASGSIVNTILQFVSEVDKEISDLKLSINARARRIAGVFLESL